MTVSDERNTPHPEDRLVDLLYPEGQDAARLAVLRAEVAADPALREKLRQYEAVRLLVAELPVPEPERAVHYELVRQARAAVETSGAPRTGLWAWLSTLQLGPVLAGALGLMLAVGGTMMLTHESADFAPAPASITTPGAVTAPSVVAVGESTGAKPNADTWAAPQKTLAAAPASAATTAGPVVPEPDALEAAELQGALAAAAPKEAAKRSAGAGKRDAQLDDLFGDAGEGQGYGLGKGSSANIGGLGAAGAGRGGGGRADANAAGPASAFPAEQARREASEARRVEEKSVADAPKARAFAPPPPTDNALAQEADDGIVHGVAAEPAPVQTPPPAPAPAPAAPRRAAESKPTSVATAKSAPGGGYAPISLDEAAGDDVATAPSPPMAQAPAAPPPPPAESVAQNERFADKDSAPVSKKAKAKAEAGVTSPLELARMARKVQQWREAARRYEEFIDRFPNHAELPAALFETAETYERLGESARAIELYRLVARNGGGLADRALDRISELEGRRRKQAAPAKPSPQAAPAADFESEVPAAERK